MGFDASLAVGEQLDREPALSEKLNYPNVMRVYDGDDRSRVSMVMEWCGGRLLCEILNFSEAGQGQVQRRPLRYLCPWQHVVRIALGQLFSGLTPLAVMHEHVVNYPVPPRIADAPISPQLQKILYRALERDPRSR